jgi:hypothetical protein
MKYLKLYEEYVETQPDLKKSTENNFIFIDSISEVPKVGIPMNKEEFKRDDISKLDWDNIVVVRSTNEIPTIERNNMILHTSRAVKSLGWTDDFMKNLRARWEKDHNNQTWDEFEKEYKDSIGDRWTKHFTLNHLVEDHSWGSWSGNNFVYLMPGKSMVKLNGGPASLYAIDTWWSKSVVIPENTVVLYTKNAKDDIEKISIKFNSELEGQKLRNPVYFLQINSIEDVNKVIEQMGYSTIAGGQHYSSEDNIDSEFMDFSVKNTLPNTGLHANTFWSELENSRNPSMYKFFYMMDELLKFHKDEKKMNQWYDSQRRIIKSLLDRVLSRELDYKSQNEWDYIKSVMDNYPTIKNLKKDIIEAFKRNNKSL